MLRPSSASRELNEVLMQDPAATVVRKEATITYRGGGFALGRAEDFYGIWSTGQGSPVLVGHWPATASGWYQAWARLAELEQAHPREEEVLARPLESAPLPKLAVALIAGGVALGIASLFPAYLNGASLAGQADQLVEHAIFLAGWIATALLLGLGGSRRRAGAAFGIGLSAVSLGFYLGDLGGVVASGAHVAGAGLLLGFLGWIACAEGCALAVVRFGGRRAFGPLRGAHPGVVAIAVLLGLGLAASFAPAWDSFQIFAATTGRTVSVTAGDAFAGPWAIIAANVVVMVLLAAAVVLGACLRRIALGVALLAGALVPMAAQIISAVVQAATPPTAASFGISSADVAAERLRISTGFTPDFYLYCAVFGALALFGAVRWWSSHHELRSSVSFFGAAPAVSR
jgi:hypothetical protein